MTQPTTLRRRTLLGATAALGALALPGLAQTKTVLRAPPRSAKRLARQDVDRIQGCAEKERTGRI